MGSQTHPGGVMAAAWLAGKHDVGNAVSSHATSRAGKRRWKMVGWCPELEGYGYTMGTVEATSYTSHTSQHLRDCTMRMVLGI